MLDNLPDMRDEEHAFSYAEVDVVEFRKLLREVHEHYIEFMLPDEIDPEHGVEDFHLMVFSRFVDMAVSRDVAALPRDHAKTTYLRLAFTYLMWFTPLQFFVYMSATHGAASASLQVIYNMLTDENAVEILGAPIPTKVMRFSEGHLEFYLHWYDEHGNSRKKLVILKALGAQQQIRGMNVHKLRPQYVGCDDIEDETAVKTKEGYEKFKAWFDNTFMRAVSRQKGKNKVAQIGNLIGLETLLNDNIKDPDWRAMRLGVVRLSGQPLWANRFSLPDIKKDLEAAKRRGQLSTWFGEMMNMPLNVETALIDFDKIAFTNRRSPGDGNDYKCFITIDPAISAEETADDAAIVLHTIDDFGMPQATEYIYHRGMTPEIMANNVEYLCEKWDCWVVGVESVALQTVLLHYFELHFHISGRRGMDFVPIKVGKANKTARLRTWAAALTVQPNGEFEYSLGEGDWDMSTQLIQFDTRSKNNKDDLVDAGSMGLYMLRNFETEIYKDRTSKVIPQVQNATGSSTSM